MILGHTYNIQSFQSYSLVFANKSKREFVLEVTSLICYFIMEYNKSLFGFCPVLRTFLFPWYSFLKNFKPLKWVFQVSRILNLYTCGKHCKVFDTYIYTYGSWFCESFLYWKLFSIFNKDTDIVMPFTSPWYRSCFKFTFKLPVKNCFNFSNFGKFYGIVFKVNKVVLRYRERFYRILFWLELRESIFFLWKIWWKQILPA